MDDEGAETGHAPEGDGRERRREERQGGRDGAAQGQGARDAQARGGAPVCAACERAVLGDYGYRWILTPQLGGFQTRFAIDDSGGRIDMIMNARTAEETERLRGCGVICLSGHHYGVTLGGVQRATTPYEPHVASFRIIDPTRN